MNTCTSEFVQHTMQLLGRVRCSPNIIAGLNDSYLHIKPTSRQSNYQWCIRIIAWMLRSCLLFLHCHLYHHHRSYRRPQDAKPVEETVRSFARCKRFFLLEIAHWIPPSSYPMALPHSVKRLGCEADNSSASGVEVKNECSYGWLHTAMSSWGEERQLDYRSQRVRRVFVDVRNGLFVLGGQ